MYNKKKAKSRKGSSAERDSSKNDENINSVNDVIDMTQDVKLKDVDLFIQNAALFKGVINSKEEIIKAKDVIIQAKDTIIRELNEKVALLQEKITHLSKNDASRLKYSEVVGKESSASKVCNLSTSVHAIQNKKNCLIIKPTEIQENKKTRKDIGKCINPLELKVQIKKVEDLQNGGVKIECVNVEDITKIQKQAENRLGTGYKVAIQNKKQPKLKVIGIEDMMSEDELVSSILTKNDCLENPRFKLITMKKMKTKYMAILEVDGKNFKNILNKGILFIGFSVCSVFEHIDLLRCYKCTGYYHKVQSCTKLEVCLKCGNQGHQASECSTTEEHIVCPNCSEQNAKFNTGYSINHKPFDFNCSVYKINMEKAKMNINYDDTE